MITAVVMPQLGLEVAEGTVVEVLVAVGERVAKDAPVLVLTTDKADADVVAPRDGFVREILVAAGETVIVGQTLLQIADSADEPLDAAPAAVAATSLAPAERDEPIAAAAATGSRGNGGSTTLRAAPVARRAAAQLGVVLEEVAGTGPRGRITLDDVRRAAGELPADAAPAPARLPDALAPSRIPVTQAAADGEFEQFSPLRRAIARRMTMSQQIPQYQLVRDVDATHLLAQKKAAGTKAGAVARVGVNDLLVQAIAETVMRHPVLAASYVEAPDATAGLSRRAGADVGLAVATPAGLVVPVINRAHELDLQQIAAQRSSLVGAARAGGLRLDQMSGGVITLSNLGGFGIDHFNAMVNPGESAIVAVGRILDRVTPSGRGIAVVPTLRVTVTFDHRVADGAEGAAALSTLGELLEGAMQWR